MMNSIVGYFFNELSYQTNVNRNLKKTTLILTCVIGVLSLECMAKAKRIEKLKREVEELKRMED